MLGTEILIHSLIQSVLDLEIKPDVQQIEDPDNDILPIT